MAQDDNLIGNWLFNKFQYSGVFVIVIWGVEHKIKK